MAIPSELISGSILVLRHQRFLANSTPSIDIHYPRVYIQVMETTTSPSPRQMVRLASMSTEDLRNLAGADDRYAYTAAEQTRFARTRQMCGDERPDRIGAGGR